MASMETVAGYTEAQKEVFETPEISYQMVKTTDRKPEQPAHKRPVLLCGGFSASERAMNGAAAELVAGGLRVITYEQNPNLICGTDEGFSVHHSRKAATILTTLRQCDVPKVDVVAYSEAAISALLAAVQWPELFGNIVLMKPAGLVGPKSFLYFLGRSAICVGIDSKRIHQRPAAVLAVCDSLRYIMKSPGKSIKEVKAISKAEVEGLISKVQASGIKVGVVLANKDGFFRPDEVVARAISRVDALAFINSREATHSEAILAPITAMGAAQDMLQELENRQ